MHHAKAGRMSAAVNNVTQPINDCRCWTLHASIFMVTARKVRGQWRADQGRYCDRPAQGDYDGRGQQTASPMLTAIMSGGVGISGRELSTQLINSLEQANHSFS